MRPYRAVLLALVVVCAASAATVPVGATDGAGVGTNLHAADASHAVGASPHVADREPANAGQATTVSEASAVNNSTANASLGADISAFMQSSAAEVGGAVDTGMWTAAFNATRNQSVQVALVERRTGQLRSRLSDLQQRKAQLITERGDNVSETAYQAQISHLLGRIDALRMAIDVTSDRARQVDAEAETLDALRTETENLTGPEIAAVAQNLTGVGDGRPVGVTTGNGSSGNGLGNGSNGNGPGNGASDATTGPPSDAGNATTGSSNGNGDGQSNGAASDRSNGNDDASGPANGSGNATTGPSNGASDAAADPPDDGATVTTTAGQRGQSDQRASSSQSSDRGNASTAANGSTALGSPSSLVPGSTSPTALAEDAVDAASAAFDRAMTALPW
jgi:hypothetical protein